MSSSTSGLHLSVTCEDSGKGTVGSAGGGSITNFTLSNCAAGPESECQSEYAITATHLPWKTELGGLESQVEGFLATGGSGTAGFAVSCERKGTRGVEVHCEKQLPGMKLTNNKERGVLAEFNETAFECTSGTGELSSSSLTLNLVSGETLRVT